MRIALAPYPWLRTPAFFLPAKPLAPGTVYAATFRAVVDGSPVRFAWTFVTAK